MREITGKHVLVFTVSAFAVVSFYFTSFNEDRLGNTLTYR
mgnify:CR=1 FL=1